FVHGHAPLVFEKGNGAERIEHTILGRDRKRMVLNGVRKSHLLAQPHHALAARAAGKVVDPERHHGFSLTFEPRCPATYLAGAPDGAGRSRVPDIASIFVPRQPSFKRQRRRVSLSICLFEPGRTYAFPQFALPVSRPHSHQRRCINFYSWVGP